MAEEVNGKSPRAEAKDPSLTPCTVRITGGQKQRVCPLRLRM